MNPQVHQHNGHEWRPAAPLPIQPGIDFEVSGSGPWIWEAYSGVRLLASGRARTRLGLVLGMWAAKRRLAWEASR